MFVGGNPSSAFYKGNGGTWNCQRRYWNWRTTVEVCRRHQGRRGQRDDSCSLECTSCEGANTFLERIPVCVPACRRTRSDIAYFIYLMKVDRERMLVARITLQTSLMKREIQLTGLFFCDALSSLYIRETIWYTLPTHFITCFSKTKSKNPSSEKSHLSMVVIKLNK